MIGAGGGNGSKDGTILLDCVNCQRQVRSVFASMAWINVVQIDMHRIWLHVWDCRLPGERPVPEPVAARAENPSV